MTTQTEVLKLAFDLTNMHHTDYGYLELRSKVRQLAKEALAQPEQEPVAWKLESGQAIWFERTDPEAASALPPDVTMTPLYTTPPQRKPLTDEQITALLVELCVPKCYEGVTETFTAVVRAIEAAHGI